MNGFNDKNFLLNSDYGKRLYHEVAASLPIIDPHNHIDTAALATNRQFENIYQLWVQNDPYKHRAMRIIGIEENLITGSKPDYEKFFVWAKCFPSTAGNPLFHWSCMELKQIFGIDALLNEENAKHIWDVSNENLAKGNFGALDILKGLGVESLCTSDDLLDSLEYHISLANQKESIICLPSLRADSIINFNTPTFFEWLNKLQLITNATVTGLDSYQEAIIKRLDFFDNNGCLLSDHSLDGGFTYSIINKQKAEELFAELLQNKRLSESEYVCLQSYLLHFLGKEYAQRKWILQLHIGAHRFTSSRLRNKVGPAGGYACIGKTVDVSSLCSFLDELDKVEQLPKTILYTLNPADNAVFASLTGSYSEDGVRGKIQYGPAWWYNDHYEGILQQLKALSHYGLLSTSIGMTTDSRSILSFLRHNYFRRILCNLLGEWVESGLLPDDWSLVSGMVENISYYNIKNWLRK